MKQRKRQTNNNNTSVMPSTLETELDGREFKATLSYLACSGLAYANGEPTPKQK